MKVGFMMWDWPIHYSDKDIEPLELINERFFDFDRVPQKDEQVIIYIGDYSICANVHNVCTRKDIDDNRDYCEEYILTLSIKEIDKYK